MWHRVASERHLEVSGHLGATDDHLVHRDRRGDVVVGDGADDGFAGLQLHRCQRVDRIIGVDVVGRQGIGADAPDVGGDVAGALRFGDAEVDAGLEGHQRARGDRGPVDLQREVTDDRVATVVVRDLFDHRETRRDIVVGDGAVDVLARHRSDIEHAAVEH